MSAVLVLAPQVFRRELEGQASEQQRLAPEDLSASSALFLPLVPPYLRQQEEKVTLQDPGSELIAPKVIYRHQLLLLCITNQESFRLC